MSALRWLRDAAMRAGGPVTLAALVVALLAAGGAEAQQACTNTGGTCRPITQDGICESGEKLEQASCGQVGMKCCAPEACAERAGFCHVGESACPGDTTRLGRPTDCGVNVGVCCTTSQLTCNQLLGHPGTCSQTEACPSGTNEGRTSDCVSCCNPPGAPPAPTPTPGPGGGTYKIEFIHTDALGSVRMVTDQSGAVVSRHDYYPFGGEIVGGVNGRTAALDYSVAPSARQRFTGKERDDESGLDYFGARYYSGGMGRFTTPDAPFADQATTNPQTWNLYVYGRNRPLNYVDPTGRGAIWVYQLGGRATLVIPVHFVGENASPKLVGLIVARLNGLALEDPKIKLLVVSTDTAIGGVLNQMDLSPTLDYKKFPKFGEGTNTMGGNEAHIDTEPGRNAIGGAAHDTLHFAGIDEGYVDGPRDEQGNRTSTPKRGYDDSDIMTARSGTKLKAQDLQQAKLNPSTKQCTGDPLKPECK